MNKPCLVKGCVYYNRKRYEWQAKATLLEFITIVNSESYSSGIVKYENGRLDEVVIRNIQIIPEPIMCNLPPFGPNTALYCADGPIPVHSPCELCNGNGTDDYDTACAQCGGTGIGNI